MAFRVTDADEAFDVLKHDEQSHAGMARRTLQRMMPGYDFSDGQRRELAESAVIEAFAPLSSD